MYVLIDLLCGAVVPVILVLIYCRLDKKRSTGKTILLVLFTLYLAELFIVVGIQALQYCSWAPNINYTPFRDYRGRAFMFQITANAVLFMPFGCLLPLIWKSFRKFPATLISGFLTSLFIEVAQLFSFRASDIDDLMMNTLGTVIGYLLVAIFAKKKWKNEKSEVALERKRDRIELLAVMGVVVLSAMFIRNVLGNIIYGIIT